MKTAKNSLKNIGLVRLILLFAITFVTNVFSMKVSEQAKNIAFKKRIMQKQKQLREKEKEKEKALREKEKDERLQHERDKKHELGKYFIYEKGTSNGILVDVANAKFFSNSIKNMVNDLGGEPKEISLPYSVDQIKLSFDFLDDTKKVLPLKQWIDIANVCNYLHVENDKLDIILAGIRKDIALNKDDTKLMQDLQNLNSDTQKLLMLVPTINCLKNFIIKKYAKLRKGKILQNDVKGVICNPDGKSFVSMGDKLILWNIINADNVIHQELLSNAHDISCIAFSPDGKLLASGGSEKFILWNRNNSMITSKDLIGHQGAVTRVAFSPDSTKIVSEGANDLILWDISDPNNIIHKVLEGHAQKGQGQNDISSVAFSPDNTKIVSGSYGKQNNLILWNISDINNITHQELVGQPSGVHNVIFNPNGRSILSSSQSTENSLILWDISDINNITHQVLQQKYIISMAFNSDGTKIASGGTGLKGDNFILWNISDINNITHKSLIGLPHTVNSVAFSPDDKSIVAGCWNLNDSNNLALWDISNPNNITHQKLIGQPHAVERVGFSPDGTKIFSVGGKAGGFKLMLSSLLTYQEELLLQALKGYIADQVTLIYIFCLKALKGEKISLNHDSEEYKIFMTLPEGMQKLLQDLLFSQGWFSGLFSGWWK